MPNGGDQLEGRNVVFEALSRKRRRVRRIRLDERAKPSEKLEAILELAHQMGVPVVRVPRESLDRESMTGVHNGILAEADPLPENSVRGVLSDCANRGEHPFVVLVDEVQYEHNLGAIMRSALGAGVHKENIACALSFASARVRNAFTMVGVGSQGRSGWSDGALRPLQRPSLW